MGSFVSAWPEAVQLGEWRVDPELDLVARDGHAIKIEPRAMRVLSCLIERSGHIVSVSELLEEVWPDVVVGPDSVYQAIALLRRTLGDDSHHPIYIAHVPRKGYRLVAPVGAPAPAVPHAASGSAVNGSAANSSVSSGPAAQDPANGSANDAAREATPRAGASSADAQWGK
jgi:DNA-binding winged helix-turn-helix (wHTH) protein